MTAREEKLIDLLAQALPYLEDVEEFHVECMKAAGKARLRQLICDVRSEVDAPWAATWAEVWAVQKLTDVLNAGDANADAPGCMTSSEKEGNGNE